MTIDDETLVNEALSYFAKSAGVDFETMKEDFRKFNAEIDRVIAETGVDEDSAIIAVMDSWVFPMGEEV